MFIIFMRFGKFLSVLSSNIFLVSLSLFLGPQFTYLLDPLHYHKSNQESAFFMLKNVNVITLIFQLFCLLLKSYIFGPAVVKLLVDLFGSFDSCH